MREELGRLGGVPVRDLTTADLRVALTSPNVKAELERLSPDDAAALAQRVRDLLAEAGRDMAAVRGGRDRLEAAADVARASRRLGLLDGLREAMAAGVGDREPKVYTDAAVPWSSLVPRFLPSRPGLSLATLKSYGRVWMASNPDDKPFAAGVNRLRVALGKS